ncbi:peptidoglycan DD-metalloendopeptidase family protein [Methylobacillus gramineus]|uniref:peptidoglycan DD-metalloendopeptidase family protein n=1 Tax=Methylobacillus gramineus TaxID=755169 RepID=UPI001CFFF001|nr:peptidoglycan DD-metalloendopeptidase family protein [Methylobacillus gramineus]MCB5184672.1 peptidoglycan DD-metalloendopeptidase family protein [Methylobacillus gramineus]
MHVIKQVKKSWLISLLLIGCSTTDHAPVIDRAPVAKKPASSQAKSSTDKDWRPNTHTVKKGDTLYSIGLEYGYDYKEIAQANHIVPPAFTIHIGQQLKLPARATDTAAAASPIPGQPASATDGDVIITPLNMDGGAPPAVAAGQPNPGQSPAPGQPLLVVEPKATREPYSLAAMNAPVASPKPQLASPVVPAPSAATGNPADTQAPASQAAASNTEDGIQWAWPTNGKVVGNFNDSTNAKGLDISGAQGQAVNAAAPGKVIYSGSDLRGYGKLVIIKHNSTYLSVYAHNSNILVKEGQQVTRGQKIAEMGNTDADKVKLHFEIRRQGKSVDPAKYLPGSPG